MKLRKILLLLLASPTTASNTSNESSRWSQFPKTSAAWATRATQNLLPKQRATAGAASVVATYALYSMIVQKYAEYVLEQMLAVPKPDNLELNDVGVANDGVDGKNNHPIIPSELRRTVSKRNNLVTNPRDRLRWNQWIARKDQKLDTVEAADIRSLWGNTSGGQTELRFKYRTGVNQEEIAALCKPFWSRQRFKFTFSRTGRMVFSKPTDDSKDALANVFIQEYFLIGGWLRMHVTWYGKVVPNQANRGRNNPNSGHDYKYNIEWTSTKAKSFPLWNNKKTKTILNPEPSTAMSKTPWDIVKMEDGMICLRRGDVGYLVYDSN